MNYDLVDNCDFVSPFSLWSDYLRSMSFGMVGNQWHIQFCIRMVIRQGLTD